MSRSRFPLVNDAIEYAKLVDMAADEEAKQRNRTRLHAVLDSMSVEALKDYLVRRHPLERHDEL